VLGEGEVETAVIVVPASLKWQWAEQCAKLTDVPTMQKKVKKESITIPDESAMIVVEGSAAQRKAQYTKIKETSPNYVVLGYENVVNDWAEVRRINPGIIVLDEATAIKTFKAQRTRKIKRLSAPYRLALTGTPIENRPEELFSIMQWVDDTVLGRFDLFDRSFITRNFFGGVVKYKNLPVLHAKLATAMVRKTRLDEEVAPYLPDVTETVDLISLDPKSRSLYKRITSDLLDELAQVGPSMQEFNIGAYYGGTADYGDPAQGRIMAKTLALMMLCDHPALIQHSANQYADSERRRNLGEEKATWPGSAYAYELQQDGVLAGLTRSPKLEHLTERVNDILDTSPDNKVIIFSFFKEMLNLVEASLPPGICTQFHGDLSSAEKSASKARFTRDPGCRVFLSSDAGGYGVDLYMANYLINLDLAWSAGKMDQRNGRHVRAASNFSQVHILNLLIKGSVEERTYKMLDLKRRVGSAIMDNRGADNRGRVVNDLASLTQFLHETAV
jgi:SNF2 family DNA or RNA helicase